MTEFNVRIYKNGMIKLSHTLTKGLTPPNAIVLSRYMTEHEFAVEHNYITEDDFFVCDEKELSYHTGLSEDVICNLTHNLIQRKILHGKIVDEHYLIRIDYNKISELVNELEKEEANDYGCWDYGLEKIQKKIHKLNVILKENKSESIKNGIKKISRPTFARNS